ncbi:MAG: ATP-binding protein [Mangrovibacterium sp.]
MKRFQYSFVCFIVFLFFAATAKAQSPAIDSLVQVLPGQKGEGLARVYLELSKEYSYIDPARTVEYANLAMPIILENQNKEQETYANLLLGAGYLFLGDFEAGKKYTEVGLELANEIRHIEYTCIGQNSLAAYYMNVGEYDMAVQLFRETVEKATDAGLEDRAATAQLNLGSILTNRGERTKGLRHLLEALAYFEKEGDPQIIARILNNVAVNYHAWKDYDKALEFYERTLVTYRELGDFVGQAIVINNIGEIYKDKKEYQKALSYYQSTLQIAQTAEIGDYYSAYGWIGLAETYLLLGEYQLSRENVNLAFDVFEHLKMQEGIANAKLILSKINLAENQLSEALLDVDESLALSVKIGIIDLEKEGYAVKSAVLEKQKRYKEAFDMLKMYAQKSDTLYNEERTNDFAQLRSELEMSEKQNEIELLQKNNQIKDLQINRQKTQTQFLFLTVGLLIVFSLVMFSYMRSRKNASDLLQEKNRQINEQHDELVRVNETKDKFMSIIGHDLRNPIGAFKDVLDQLADFPEMFSDELRQQIIHELRDEAESTYFLLDNLLSWAKSQKNSIAYKPERLELNTLVSNTFLLNSRLSESKQIRLRSDVNGDHVAYADQNMTSLILRNLISNAIKFTRDGGEVSITAKESGDWVAVSVADTGIGISREQQARLFNENNPISTYGTNHEKGSGLGLLLCKEFVDIHGGTLAVHSEPGKGSTFTFTLKKYKDTI